MGAVPYREDGMDVVIVSTPTERQEHFWQKRLAEKSGFVTKKSAYIIVVHEDWTGGAGNGLGTLYAYQKAIEKGKVLYNIDLNALLKKGNAIAIYHTAGLGKRMFPLTAAEYSNKPAVKLPSQLSEKFQNQLITILESVIIQTSQFAQYLKGRLSVFWGDQIFLPLRPLKFQTDSHIEIFAKIAPLPTKEEWTKRGLDKYGFIAIDRFGQSQQLDKCNYTTITGLIKEGRIFTEGGVGISLGSFSLSAPITEALLVEFHEELSQKKRAMDSEPFIWMPTTLDLETYSDLMEKRGQDHHAIRQHHMRMQNFKRNLMKNHSEHSFFTAIDAGEDCFWWDYGNLNSYFENVLKLTLENKEAEAMRKFYQVANARNTYKPKGVAIDNCSLLIDCDIREGNVSNSVLVGVHAEKVDITDSVLINCTLGDFKGENALLYNVIEEKPIEAEKNLVRADVYLPGAKEHLKVYTKLGRNGKEDWEVKHSENVYTYKELHAIAQEVDLTQARTYAQRVKENALRILSLTHF